MANTSALSASVGTLVESSLVLPAGKPVRSIPLAQVRGRVVIAGRWLMSAAARLREQPSAVDVAARREGNVHLLFPRV